MNVKPYTPTAQGHARKLRLRTYAAAWRRWSARAFPLLAVTALASAFVTITLGGTVRVTESGLGCPDWPLCHGRVVPPADLEAWIEYIHRLSVVVTSLLTGLTVLAAFSRYRLKDRSLHLVLLLPVLLIAQGWLGAKTVLDEIPPKVALAHMGLATAFVGVLTLVVTGSRERASPFTAPLSRTALRFRWLLAVLALASFLLILSGAYVTREGASLACTDIPLCGTSVDAPAAQRLQDIHMLHRFAAVLVAGLALSTVWAGWQVKTRDSRIKTLGLIVVALLTLQIALGIANVLLELPHWSRIAHVAVSALFFIHVMLLLGTSWRRIREGPLAMARGKGEAHPTGLWLHTLSAYLQLTKPRIVLLLLVTTFGAMLAAGKGSVSWSLALATLAGGALSAGGAGAVNCYLDRETDQLMQRTRKRPLPSGALSPRHALWFGLALSLASVPIFFVLVNSLAGLFTIIAWFHYVLVYSVLLKRRTAQNIVIGGAAGAFPPLIGWVAITNTLEWEAVFLFLIIFFWTPPHAWALALLAKEDYTKVKIPMLPVIRGERETGRQILLYTLVLVASTALPVAFGYFGALYLGIVLPLGLLFLALAYRVWQRPQQPQTLLLWRYSTIYVAVLFLGLVLDRSLLA